MKRRTLLLAAAASAATAIAAPAQAEPIPLDEISAYFNALETLEARFLQSNGDGSQSVGTLYIRRPGRARFEYDPPEDALVMAGGGQLAIFDGRSNDPRPEQYPLRRTPLNVVLERRVDLNRREVIVDHRGTPEETIVVALDPDNPEYGRIELTFTGDPLALSGWMTIDGAGNTTRVELEGLRTGHDLSSRLFSIPFEIEARGG